MGCLIWFYLKGSRKAGTYHHILSPGCLYFLFCGVSVVSHLSEHQSPGCHLKKCSTWALSQTCGTNPPMGGRWGWSRPTPVFVDHWFKALTAPEKSAQVQRTHTTVFSSHSSLGLRPFIRLMVVISKTYAFQYWEATGKVLTLDSSGWTHSGKGKSRDTRVHKGYKGTQGRLSCFFQL